ncbi:MAG: HD domain-containing protein [Chlamydiae bacterium]|nr:HD domain-containing protein [Chlamydiota bacterium]
MNFCKKIFDPVHGFIKLTESESLLVDSAMFSRLHYIRQLGVAYLVYPGATHTRFEHSLGVMEIATQLFEQITEKSPLGCPVDETPYWKEIVRLAALSHDLGHLPFSHVAEKRILGAGGHEKWTVSAIESPTFKPIWQALATKYSRDSAKDHVLKVAIGEEKLKEMQHPLANAPFTDWERVMSEIITGDYFGADRIDYLLRDARCTGLSYGLFDYHQLIEMMCILPDPIHGKLSLGIDENALESCEALLLARHFMYKRVYQYPSVKAYGFHMSRFMQYYYHKHQCLSSLASYQKVTDSTILEAASAECELGDAAHPDAVALFDRKKRIFSCELTGGFTDELCKEFLDSESIQQSQVEWSLDKRLSIPSSTFPVRLFSGEIVDASKCSRLLYPAASSHWIYMPKVHKRAFQQFMLDKKHLWESV